MIDVELNTEKERGTEMSLTIKNEYIKKIKSDAAKLDSKLAPKRTIQIMQSLSSEEIGNTILWGFFESLMEIAEERGIDLDLTYEKTQSFPAALAALYNVQKNSYTPEKNTEIIGKTIAAYLTLLCINEHNCIPAYSQINTSLYASQKDVPKTWGGGIKIEVGTESRVDFYQSGLNAVNQNLIDIENGVYVDMMPIMSLYRRATGVRLKEYGIGNIMISAK